MTLPFHRGHRRGHETDAPDDRSDAQLLARLGSASDRRNISAAHDRVWQRLVSEHPALGQAAPRRQRPTPIAAGLVTGSSRRSPLPISRRAPGGWRAAFDVAAVAVLAIGLLLTARGVGIMPNGGNPNPMMTQSAAAASPTQPLAVVEGGTNRQPGPGPRVTPTLVSSGGELRRIQGDLIYADGVVYALTSLTTDTFIAAGYNPGTLEQVWSSPQTGDPIDMAVSGTTVSIVTKRADRHGTLITVDSSSSGRGRSIDLPFEPLTVASTDATILVSGHDESTGTPNAGQPSDMSRLLAIDPDDGSTRWDIGLTNPAGMEPLLTDEAIYYTTANGAAKAIDLDSGTTRWTTGTGGQRITSDPVVSGDLLYVIRPDGVVHALDRLTGEQRWGQGVRTRELGVPPLVITIGATAVSVPAPILALSEDGNLLIGYVWANGDLSGFRITGEPLDPASLTIDIVALDASAGTTRWYQSAASPFEPISENLELGLTVATDQMIITDGSSVSARLTISGDEIWRQSVEGTVTGNLVVVDHSVIFTRNVSLAALREAGGMAGTADAPTPAQS